MTRLRVVTLNIWHDSCPWTARRALIRDELRWRQPDLVGLQEVLRDGASCQARQLADGLGYEVAYARACRRADGTWHGNALLSRLPVQEQATLDLPSDGV